MKPTRSRKEMRHARILAALEANPVLRVAMREAGTQVILPQGAGPDDPGR